MSKDLQIFVKVPTLPPTGASHNSSKLHISSELEHQLFDEGVRESDKCRRRHYYYRGDANNDVVLNEMTKADKHLLSEGLRVLAGRIAPYPGPDIPCSVWKAGGNGESIKDGSLPQSIIDALAKKTDKFHEPGLMLHVGTYLYQTYSADELIRYSKIWNRNLDKESPQEILVDLAYTLILPPGICIGLDSFELAAKMLKHLSIDRLRRAATQAGLYLSYSKPDLILRLIEFMFKDVLVPSRLKDLEALAEEKLISSVNDDNLTECLHAAQVLQRPILTSTCFGYIRENPILFRDTDILVSLMEEKDKLWDKIMEIMEEKDKEHRDEFRRVAANTRSRVCSELQDEFERAVANKRQKHLRDTVPLIADVEGVPHLAGDMSRYQLLYRDPFNSIV